MSLNFDIKPMESKDSSKIVSVKRAGEIWSNFPRCTIFSKNVDVLDKVNTFKLFEEDVILCGYPRSGTTYMQEMIWLLLNNFDFDKANNVITDSRIPILENYGDECWQYLSETESLNLPHPRAFKTHFPVQFLPDDLWVKKPKLIYISRDPRDVAISSFHLAIDMFHLKIELNEFLEDFLTEKAIYGPYWENRLNFETIPYENILYLNYESVTSNINETIENVAQYLGVTVSESNHQLLKEHLKFCNMKKNNACNNKAFLEKMNEIHNEFKSTEDGFIRRGVIGSHKDEMPKELIEKFDERIADRNTIKSSWKHDSRKVLFDQKKASTF